MLFAGDQKVEHLNDDFYGDDIHPDDADPEHLFRIAAKAKIGLFASQLGLVARYGCSPYYRCNRCGCLSWCGFCQGQLSGAREGSSDTSIKEAVLSAGRTKVVCAGGASDDAERFLKLLYHQIHVCGVAGNATGRNIHQRSYEEAVRFCNAIYAVTVEGGGTEDALQFYRKPEGE